MKSARTLPSAATGEPHASGQDLGDGMVVLDGQEMYRIAHHDLLPPFLMNIVSESDRWMYVSSTGGLTAGRIDPDHCLFPYETEDRLHYLYGISGPLTILRVHDAKGGWNIWEPFAPAANPALTRNLYKNYLGNQLVFEEINESLGLTFRYRWSGSEEFGFIRTVTLSLSRKKRRPLDVEWIDGLLNLLPCGLGLALQQGFSSLCDAYKYSEIDPETGLGIFSLASLLTDRAEPAEALKATVAWSRGVTPKAILLSTEQLQAFRQGETVHSEGLLTGRRGNYLVCAAKSLKPGESVTWDIVADVDRDHLQVERLRTSLCAPDKIDLQPSVAAGSEALEPHGGRRRRVASLGRSDHRPASFRECALQHHARRHLRPQLRRPGRRFRRFRSSAQSARV